MLIASVGCAPQNASPKKIAVIHPISKDCLYIDHDGLRYECTALARVNADCEVYHLPEVVYYKCYRDPKDETYINNGG
jgi:hypothetical protein